MFRIIEPCDLKSCECGKAPDTLESWFLLRWRTAAFQTSSHQELPNFSSPLRLRLYCNTETYRKTQVAVSLSHWSVWKVTWAPPLGKGWYCPGGKCSAYFKVTLGLISIDMCFISSFFLLFFFNIAVLVYSVVFNTQALPFGWENLTWTQCEHFDA